MKMRLTAKFVLFLSSVVGIVLSISFYIVNKHQEQLIFNQIEREAKTVVKQIIITRAWIADQGGVFVKKSPHISPNPYLIKVGIQSETKDRHGRTYVLKNPALVTRELSQYAEKFADYKFRITSLKLINPSNAPDDIERKALVMFENKQTGDFTAIDDIEGEKYFRYIYPLYIDKACLQCHKLQGYQTGEIKGAISIFIPVDKVLKEINSNKNKLVLIMGITIFSLMLAVFLLVKFYVSSPLNKLKKSIKEFRKGNPPKDEIVKTGDEFEEICITFKEMADDIYHSHQSLNDRIKEATKELEEANQKLLELNTRKSDFIARAAHELRTPLTSIKGAADYLTRTLLESVTKDDNNAQKIAQFLEIITRNSKRLIRMVKDMLDLERIEAGIMEFDYTEGYFKKIVEETVLEISQRNEKNIRFIIDIPENLLVFADVDKIQQVISNLLLNAINFSPLNSEVIIRGKMEKDKVRLEIIDQGPGIPYEEQQKIFNRFYKIKNTAGTGLGLTISKAIVEAHGGFIGVKSDEKHGSTFYFVIPRRNDG